MGKPLTTGMAQFKVQSVSLLERFEALSTCLYHNNSIKMKVAVLVGPCHHGMARPQVAASDKEGSCE